MSRELESLDKSVGGLKQLLQKEKNSCSHASYFQVFSFSSFGFGSTIFFTFSYA